MRLNSEKMGKPFIKWAGGKTQLLGQIDQTIPDIYKSEKFTYIEPFLGGGAVLFHLLNNYPNLEKAIVNDINADLVGTYRTIKNNIDDLVEILEKFQLEYHNLLGLEEEKKAYFYSKRKLFNERTVSEIEQSALFIFLNKTCFNGLFRVNKKNEFNVPIGRYKKPLICDKNNLFIVSELLQKVEILNGDFEETIDYTDTNTLFYFDPPYKPLSDTSSFNSYAKDDFNDSEQIRLAEFCKRLDVLGDTWILSNSDVNSGTLSDDFFDELYKRFNIKRVLAKRSINANPNKRGQLTELLITNYQKNDVKEVI